jgi:hypothetical protein
VRPEGFIEVINWWNEEELIQLLLKLRSGQLRMLDKLYKMNINKHPQFERILKPLIVHWAARQGRLMR